MESSRCRDLALEGERLCRSGDWQAGVTRLEEALQEGCTDLSTLSFAYGHLGEAYFYLTDYERSLDCHRQDAKLKKRAGDRTGEAKAYGNLGNVQKAIGRFDEAVASFHRQLALAQEVDDKVRESKAFYSLGNVYHSKGKEAANGLQLDPGQYPVSVKEALQNAACFYEASLQLVQELTDKVAEGRACGNLGNTHYLLGNFEKAIKYHNRRLEIAQEFQDRSAERRACTNLGNAHVFLCQFKAAAKYYRKTLLVALETKDRAVEAQACYSLGNTYTLLKDYTKATEYHLRHLEIARELSDKMGEARACWSLGNAYTAMGNYRQAFGYAVSHHQLAVESHDLNGASTARENIKELKSILGIPLAASPVPIQPEDLNELQHEWDGQLEGRLNQDDHLNKEVAEEFSGGHDYTAGVNGDVPASTQDQATGHNSDSQDSAMQEDTSLGSSPSSPCGLKEVEDVTSAELVDVNGSSDAICQQPAACAVSVADQSSVSGAEHGRSLTVTDSFLNLLSNNQGRRIDDQRYTWPSASCTDGSHGIGNSVARDPAVVDHAGGLDDAFLDLLVRCQGNRFEDQRSAPPPPPPPPLPPLTSSRSPGSTIPDEDFFNLIVRLQSHRLEDQRTSDPM